MTEPVTLFVNRARLIDSLTEKRDKLKSDREAAKKKRDDENNKVRDQLIELLTNEPEFLVWAASATRREYGVAVGESFAGLKERFAHEDEEPADDVKPYEEEKLDEFIKLYGLSDSDQVELAPGSEVLNHL